MPCRKGGTDTARAFRSLVMPRFRPLLTVLLGALAVPAVFALDLGSLPVETPVVTPSPSVSSYLHDVSQPIPGVSWMTSISEHHRITMADGVELDAWIVRP